MFEVRLWAKDLDAAEEPRATHSSPLFLLFSKPNPGNTLVILLISQACENYAYFPYAFFSPGFKYLIFEGLEALSDMGPQALTCIYAPGP